MVRVNFEAKSVVDMTEEEVEAFRKKYGIVPFRNGQPEETKTKIFCVNQHGKYQSIDFECDGCGKRVRGGYAEFKHKRVHYCGLRCRRIAETKV